MALKAVIIGGGVVGCITAIKLKENGYDVTLVDKSFVGEESSAAGAGIIFPLMPWNYESRVFDLCLGALSFYKNLSIKLIKAGFEDPEFIESGMICIDPSDKKKIVQWGEKNNFTIKEYLFNTLSLEARYCSVTLGISIWSKFRIGAKCRFVWSDIYQFLCSSFWRD